MVDVIAPFVKIDGLDATLVFVIDCTNYTDKLPNVTSYFSFSWMGTTRFSVSCVYPVADGKPVQYLYGIKVIQEIGRAHV